jgi:hypothetical protein
MGAALVVALLVAAAFAAAPRACEGGLDAYRGRWAGGRGRDAYAAFGVAASLGLALGLPLVRRDLPLEWRALLGLGGLGLGAGGWLAGLLIANVRVVCRLL